jgi:hypothetical protein
MAGSIYYEHSKGTECRDNRHRSCSDRWRGEIREGDYRRRVAGPTKSNVQQQLDEIEDELTNPLLAEIGGMKLRDLEAEDVLRGLQAITEGRSTRTVRDARACLVSAITYAQARRLVARNWPRW